jgi:DNA repair protein RecO (recombination protein O)
MEILKTTGITLSSRVSGEADIICNFYTRDCGKRKFVFKGLKKSKKRSLAATEPGAVSTLIYYHREERESFIVNDVTVEKYYTSITSDLKKIVHLYFILESVDKTCGYDISDGTIFNLLLAGIEVLSKTTYPAHLSTFLVLHLLKNHGVLSDTDTCKMCGKNRFSSFAIDVADLRPVCGTCLGDNPSGPWHRSALLPGKMREYMELCISQKFSAIDHARYDEKDVLDLLFSISLFMENYFHMEIKSKSFIFSDSFA